MEATRHGVSEGSLQLYKTVLLPLAQEGVTITSDLLKQRFRKLYGREISKQTVSNYVKELEAIGWVEMGTHPEDR